jgi:hypothetical protein
MKCAEAPLSDNLQHGQQDDKGTAEPPEGKLRPLHRTFFRSLLVFK